MTQVSGGLPRFVKTVERVAFVVDRRFRGVEVLGLIVGVNDSAAETDDFAESVAYRKRNPGSKPIIVAAVILTADKQAAALQYINGK